MAAAQSHVLRICIFLGTSPKVIILLAAWSPKRPLSATRLPDIPRHCEEPPGRANARPMTGSATKQSIFAAIKLDCFASLAMTAWPSLPGKHRLFQFGHAGIAARQHFAELVDQGGRRRVDELAAVMKADHPPCALGHGGGAER